jgi:hypothetical protein
MTQGLDNSASKTSLLDVSMHVTTHIVNICISINFNQEYVNIKLAIISLLLYL